MDSAKRKAQLDSALARGDCAGGEGRAMASKAERTEAAVAIVVDGDGNATIASDIEGAAAIADLLRGCADSVANGEPLRRRLYGGGDVVN